MYRLTGLKTLYLDTKKCRCRLTGSENTGSEIRRFRNTGSDFKLEIRRFRNTGSLFDPQKMNVHCLTP